MVYNPSTSAVVDDFLQGVKMQAQATLDPKTLVDAETGQVLGFDPALRGGRNSIDDDRWPGAAVVKYSGKEFILID